MKTFTVLIGNSDDKLTQQVWSDYSYEVDRVVIRHAQQVHFSGYSHTTSPWQNACWVIEVEEKDRQDLLDDLQAMCVEYNQDSIAVIEGDVGFVRPGE